MGKKLIAYYSYTNNTKKIAEQIQIATDADICEIETVEPYTGDYNSVVDQGKQEVDSGFKPAIKSQEMDCLFISQHSINSI
ncbi:flavodoxin [Clostridium thailandense]|uniref:flavodoxin n=1 Tax=Clostridium thailandense TaxID=2794346 RepID=UPI00398A3906